MSKYTGAQKLAKGNFSKRSRRKAATSRAATRRFTYASECKVTKVDGSVEYVAPKQPSARHLKNKNPFSE